MFRKKPSLSHKTFGRIIYSIPVVLKFLCVLQDVSDASHGHKPLPGLSPDCGMLWAGSAKLW